MTNLRRSAGVLLLVLLVALASFAGDKPKPGKTEDFTIESPLMQRTLTYRVIFPHKYKQKDEKKLYPVIYLLHGLSGGFRNWTEKTKVSEYIAGTGFIVVMPDGGDGWYTDSATVAADRYESHFITEFIPAIDAKFRTIAKREGRFITGLSMGGYGAIKFGLKYPDKFIVAGSFSGALDAPLRGQEHPYLRPSILAVFGAEASETRTRNDVFRLIREMPTETLKGLPFFYFDCGTEDWLFPTNRDFAGLLFERKIPYEFRQLPGKHDWKFWDQQFSGFVDVAGKFRGN